MRVIKFAWHLFWAARRCPGFRLGQIIDNANYQYWAFVVLAPEVHVFEVSDTELTEALRRYGR